TTVGPVCKVGGEVTHSIFHSYANKAHEGFAGHSIFGQWTNIGADTNTSNMKNNYSKISVMDYNSGKKVDTDLRFLGTIMGDHSKTAINTMLNTGTVCGVSSNLFPSGFPPKYITSFKWIGDNLEVKYRFDKAVETMKIMMGRRNISITDDYIEMMKEIFELNY
ncbi:MAG: glucose-1-phosphate thymidylyltransferase, partial [Balneolaceae bacterium]